MAEFENKRKRQPNFSTKEKFDLLSIIASKYRDILENKATDKVSMVEKEKAWVEIEKDFNSTSQVGLYRDKDCLKRFFENRKREVKKLKAQERQEILKTGGGPEKKMVFDVADEILIEIMNPKTIQGLDSEFDSDAQTNLDGKKVIKYKVKLFCFKLRIKRALFMATSVFFFFQAIPMTEIHWETDNGSLGKKYDFLDLENLVSSFFYLTFSLKK